MFAVDVAAAVIVVVFCDVVCLHDDCHFQSFDVVDDFDEQLMLLL